MGEWILAIFGDSIALLTFFSIFAAGMTFTVFQLLFGGDAEHGDLGGDHGDFGGDHDIGHDGDAHHDGDGMGVLSVRGISFLLTGFGGLAFIAMYFTEKVLVSSLIGLFGGWPFALACVAMYRVFVRQEASSLAEEGDFGAMGTVVTPIPRQGLGEVTIVVKGQQFTKPAVTDDGKALKTGTPIRVKSYLGNRVCVERPGEQDQDPNAKVEEANDG